jgi:hypothetical protein
MIKLSQTTKMPGKSWSLPAGTTCPGSHDHTGQVVPACAVCYAKVGNYAYPAPTRAREHNRQDWKRDDWVADMIQELSHEQWFRWFDSGDIHHPNLARKILEVIRGTPNTRHWIPTRSFVVPRIRELLEQIQLEPNATVRYSSGSVTGEYTAEHGSTVIPHVDWPTTASVCPSSQQGNRCLHCRKCWDKSIPVIAYVGHGVLMYHRRRREQKTNQTVTT